MDGNTKLTLFYLAAFVLGIAIGQFAVGFLTTYLANH